jgi:hypothetical protein
MTAAEAIQQIRRVNPVRADPPAPPVEQLLARLDLSARALDGAFRPRPRRAWRGSAVPRLIVGVAVGTGVVLGVAVVAGGPGGGGVNVAAAVDRAITPGRGVLHMVLESENALGGRITSTVHEEIWTSQNPRRMRILSTLKAGGETVEGEGAVLSTSPPRTLSWSASRPDVITENTSPVNATDATPVAMLHRFYSEGRLKVLGKSDLEGRPVWRLEVQRDPSAPSQSVNGQPVPAATVLVDAKTFVPIENVIPSAGSEGGHPVLQTTKVRYVTYQELPASPADERLLTLASHPGTKTVPEPSPKEH